MILAVHEKILDSPGMAVVMTRLFSFWGGGALAGILYVILSITSLLFWRIRCGLEDCFLYSPWDLLDRSWWLWGALFYAVAGVLCLELPKNRLTGTFLAAGTVFYAGLVGYGYAVTGYVCPACWKFAAIGALLAVFYWVLPDKKPGYTTYISVGPARALAVVVLALLIVNPGTEPVAALPATAVVTAGVESQSDSTKKAGPEPVEKAASYKLRVSTPDGEETYLDLREKPALFFAAWCPHCPEALKDAARLLPGKRPYLIVTYLREGDIGKAKAKLAENGLTGEPYYLVQSPPEGVQGVPSLVWWDGGEVMHVEGAALIKKELGVPELLGYAEIPNPPDGGGKNAALAAALINGKIVQPGEVFSFNRAVGPRTVSRGFVEGRSVVETVYGPKVVPDVGGGVCRASTALHLAVLDAGLEVVEHHNHSMPVSYAEPGRDAAVAWPYWDFRFRNTAGKLLVIKTRSDYGRLRVELWVQRK